MTQLRVLGPVQLLVGGRPVDLGPAKQRTVLAALLLESSQPLRAEALIERVWDDPPPGARSGLHSYVTRLRRVLGSAADAGGLPPELRHGADGYRLELGGAVLDLDRFRQLVDRGRDEDDDEQRAAALREAVGLWTGEPLAHLPGGWIGRQRDLLEEQRLDAVLLWVDAELRLGRAAAVIEPLRASVGRNPLVEPLTARLVQALYLAGRGAEALDCYARTRQRLVEDLGVEPGPELRRLHEAILRGDPVGPTPPAPTTAAGAPTTAPAVPAELPATAAGFTGRAEQFRRLDELLATQPAAAAAPLPIAVISGVGGVGKTALAVSWGHRIAHRFPDGQLFVDLRGFDAGPPVRPVAALAGFLRALGVPADRVPVDEAEAAALYRSRLAGRRVLVVLDNAADAEQVRPLLPGDPGCQVIVTSRDRAGSLVAADGARRLTLDVLAHDEAVDLLRRVAGARVDDDPAAAAELARRCGYLPLALRIAAAQLDDAAGQPVAAYLAGLVAAGPLAALEIGADPKASVRATLVASYRRLAEPERRLFRLLGLVPGSDVSGPATAALAGLPAGPTGPALPRLAMVHLVEPAGVGRYRMHDLVRQYAAELAGSDEAGADRAAATDRLLDWYLRSADAAARVLYPHVVRLDLPAGSGDGAPVGFADQAEAGAWLDAERANLVAAVQHAADRGPAPMAWLLADLLRGYFILSRHMVDWLHVTEAGLAAAVAARDVRAQAAMHLGLGAAYGCLDDHAAVIEHHQAAAELAGRAGWVAAQAASAGNLGIAHALAGNLPAAAADQTAALALYRQAGRPGGVATTLANLGGVYWAQGRLGEAARCATEALAAFRAAGSPSGEANALENLGYIEHSQGRLGSARRHLEQALAASQGAGNRYIEARARCSLTLVEHDAGRHAEALACAATAMALADEVGESRSQAEALTAAAGVELSLGRADRAADHQRRALRAAGDSLAGHQRIAALVGLAEACLAAGDPAAATAAATEALEIARRTGYRLLEGRALTALAAVRADDADAADLARQALAVHRETGHRLGEARTLLLLSRILHRRSSASAQAASAAEAARVLFAECGASQPVEAGAAAGERQLRD